MAFSSVESAPPTPPHSDDISESIDQALAFLDTSAIEDEYTKRKQYQNSPKDTQTHTPPTSSPPASTARLDARTKSIRFDLTPSFSDQPSSEDYFSVPHASLRTIPSSKDQTASRSILKPFDPSTICQTPSRGLEPAFNALAPNESFGEMLDSLLNQLSSSDCNDRLFGYDTLLSCIRTEGDIPDRAVLKSKLPAIETHLQRDINFLPYAGDSLSDERRLGLRALNLLCSLLYVFPDLLHTDSEFSAHVLDISTSAISSENVVKSEKLRYMFILSLSNFTAGSFTSSYVSLLFDSLAASRKQITGNNVAVLSLKIYHRLFDLDHALTKAHASTWLPIVLPDLVSSKREVRQAAAAAVAVAGKYCCRSKKFAETVGSNLERVIGEKYALRLVVGQRLKRMLQQSEESLEVPMIWTLQMLLLSGSRSILHSFLKEKAWTDNMSNCLNSSKTELQHRAWDAWTTIIHRLAAAGSIDKEMCRFLCKPISAWLLRRDSNAGASKIVDAVFSSYSTLLNYAFDQRQKFSIAAETWLITIDNVLESVLNKSGQFPENYSHRFSLILTYLLENKKIPQDTFETSYILTERQVTEQSTLDAAWVRQNLGIILSTLRKLGSLSSIDLWVPGNAGSELWTALMTTIATAGRKEITITRDQKAAIMTVLDFTSSLLCDLRATVAGAVELAERARPLILHAIEAVGSIYMLRNIINENNTQESKSVSPAKKSTKPICILFEILLQNIVYFENDTGCNVIRSLQVDTLLKACFQSSASPDSLSAVLDELCAQLVEFTSGRTRNQSISLLWAVLADLMLDLAPTIDGHEGIVEQDFRANALSVLEHGAMLLEPPLSEVPVYQKLKEFTSKWHVTSTRFIASKEPTDSVSLAVPDVEELHSHPGEGSLRQEVESFGMSDLEFDLEDQFTQYETAVQTTSELDAENGLMQADDESITNGIATLTSAASLKEAGIEHGQQVATTDLEEPLEDLEAEIRTNNQSGQKDYKRAIVDIPSSYDADTAGTKDECDAQLSKNIVASSPPEAWFEDSRTRLINDQDLTTKVKDSFQTCDISPTKIKADREPLALLENSAKRDTDSQQQNGRTESRKEISTDEPSTESQPSQEDCKGVSHTNGLQTEEPSEGSSALFSQECLQTPSIPSKTRKRKAAAKPESAQPARKKRLDRKIVDKANVQAALANSDDLLTNNPLISTETGQSAHQVKKRDEVEEGHPATSAAASPEFADGVSKAPEKTKSGLRRSQRKAKKNIGVNAPVVQKEPLPRPIIDARPPNPDNTDPLHNQAVTEVLPPSTTNAPVDELEHVEAAFDAVFKGTTADKAKPWSLTPSSQMPPPLKTPDGISSLSDLFATNQKAAFESKAVRSVQLTSTPPKKQRLPSNSPSIARNVISSLRSKVSDVLNVFTEWGAKFSIRSSFSPGQSFEANQDGSESQEDPEAASNVEDEANAEELAVKRQQERETRAIEDLGFEMQRAGYELQKMSRAVFDVAEKKRMENQRKHLRSRGEARAKVAKVYW